MKPFSLDGLFSWSRLWQLQSPLNVEPKGDPSVPGADLSMRAKYCQLKAIDSRTRQIESRSGRKRNRHLSKDRHCRKQMSHHCPHSISNCRGAPWLHIMCSQVKIKLLNAEKYPIQKVARRTDHQSSILSHYAGLFGCAFSLFGASIK
jgi:hypothetical protein